MQHLDLITLSKEEFLLEFLSVDQSILKFTAPSIEKISLDDAHEVTAVRGASEVL